MNYLYLDKNEPANVRGPLALAEIQRLIAEGKLSPNPKVCAEGTKDWKDFSSISVGGARVFDAPPLSPPPPNRVPTSKQPDQKTGTGEKPQSNAKGCLVILAIIVGVLFLIGEIADHAKLSAGPPKCLKKGCENIGQGWSVEIHGDMSGVGRWHETGGYCSKQHCIDDYEGH